MAEGERFIAVSYQFLGTFDLADALATSLTAFGTPCWLLRGITGNQLPQGGEQWRAYEPNWHVVWLERVREASGIIVVAEGDPAVESGLGQELRFIRSLKARHPDRVRHVELPRELQTARRPTRSNLRMSPFVEERVGYERAQEMALADLEAGQKMFDRSRKEWVEGMVAVVKEWAQQVIQLPPIASLSEDIPEASERQSDGAAAATPMNYNKGEWFRTYGSRVTWAALANIDLYDIRLHCAACGAEWLEFPEPPPRACPRCGHK